MDPLPAYCSWTSMKGMVKITHFLALGIHRVTNKGQQPLDNLPQLHSSRLGIWETEYISFIKIEVPTNQISKFILPQ